MTVYEAVDGGPLQVGGAIAAPLPIKTWLPMGMTVDFTTRTATVSRDGNTIITASLPVAVTKNNGLRIVLGIDGEGDETEYFVDDLACDLL